MGGIDRAQTWFGINHASAWPSESPTCARRTQQRGLTPLISELAQRFPSNPILRVADVPPSRPDLIVYVAGADPYVEDQLGGLCLTYEGLRGRDYLVLSSARDAGVPALIVFAGGYARRVEDTAAIHIATLEEAVRLGA